MVREVSIRLVLASGDLRAGEYFAQRLSLAIQRGNAASALGTLPRGTGLDDDVPRIREKRLRCLIAISIIIPRYNCQTHWFSGPEPMTLDLFFDRMVRIPINYTHRYVLAMLIDEDHLLTSFNPFRVLSSSRDNMELIKGIALQGRHIQNGKLVYCTPVYLKVLCGRQVVPLTKKDIEGDQWHGADYLNSPLHDIMVMQVDKKIQFVNDTDVAKPQDLYNGPKDILYRRLAGVLKTEIAKPGDYLGRELKFASFGLYNADLKRYLNDRLREYDPEDNVVVNCDEYIPREWGHFICVRNIDNYAFIGSGAMLVYNKTVYGLGSFMLKKGKQSIFVFTDVRPYRDLIFQTCTKEDRGK